MAMSLSGSSSCCCEKLIRLALLASFGTVLHSTTCRTALRTVFWWMPASSTQLPLLRICCCSLAQTALLEVYNTEGRLTMTWVEELMQLWLPLAVDVLSI